MDKQALQRAHRIGQTNHVLAINLVTERSIEEVRLKWISILRCKDHINLKNNQVFVFELF